MALQSKCYSVVMDLLEGNYSYNHAGLVEISDVIFCAVIPFEIYPSEGFTVLV